MVFPEMPDVLLARLRAATAESHQRLEATVNIEKVLRNVESYRGLLERFYGFYGPVERAAERAGPVFGYDPAARRKLPWLVADLRALGRTEAEIAGLPTCDRAPQPDDVGGLLGCAYVLEGATLGGRHISRLMEGTPIPPEARAFFSGYGEATPARWREFLGALEHFEASGDSLDPVIDKACDTFGRLEAWLKPD